MSCKKRILKRTWAEFSRSGLLWWTNRMLHVFGWAIVFQFKNGKITDVYPSRTRSRGFTFEVEAEGFQGLSRYMAKNANELFEEVLEEAEE